MWVRRGSTAVDAGLRGSAEPVAAGLPHGFAAALVFVVKVTFAMPECDRPLLLGSGAVDLEALLADVADAPVPRKAPSRAAITRHRQYLRGLDGDRQAVAARS